MSEDIKANTKTQANTSHDESFFFDEKLLEPYNYLVKIPGKKIRTKLIQVKIYLNFFNKTILNLLI